MRTRKGQPERLEHVSDLEAPPCAGSDDPEVWKHFLPSRLPSFSAPAPTDSTPPSLPPTKVTHHSAGFDKCHLFVKVALEKGNLTAARQNRALNSSCPLWAGVPPQEQSEEECGTAWGSGDPTTAPRGSVRTTEAPSARVLRSGPLLPLSLSQPFVFCCLFPGW